MSTIDSTIEFQPGIPMFRIFDAALAKRFYLEYLGFQLDFEHRPSETAPLFCQVSRGALVIQLTEHYDDCSPGAKTIVGTSDVAALLVELQTRPLPNLNPSIQTAPWGDLILKIIDPFRNVILFNQPTNR